MRRKYAEMLSWPTALFTLSEYIVFTISSRVGAVKDIVLETPLDK